MNTGIIKGKFTDKIKHILVIRFSALGDVAMVVPVLRVATETYQNIRVTVLTRPRFETLFSGIPNVDVYSADIDLNYKGLGGLKRLSGELKILNPDYIVDLHNVLRSKVLKFFLSSDTVKTAKIDKGRSEKKALTRANNKVFKQLKSTHQRYADVFAAVGLPIDLKAHKFPPRPELTTEIAVLTNSSKKLWLGIAPFAQHEGKMYPLELMEQVISKLDQSEHYEIFLLGGGLKEKEKLDSLASKYKNTKSLVGKFSFENELKLIGNLDAMLAMDSGNAHLAAMYNVPLITIWGVTHPYTGFMPFGHSMKNALLPDLSYFNKIPTSVYGNKFPKGYENVMYTISPNEVVNAVYRITNPVGYH